MSEEIKITPDNRIEIPGRAVDAEIARESEPVRRVPGPAGEVPLARPGVVRRGIDSWIEHGGPPPVTIEVKMQPPRFEVDPCPRWMRPETYRDLMIELKESVERDDAAARTFVPTKRQRWTLRHIVVVQDFPKLESDAGAYDLIGPVSAMLRVAKKHGLLDRVGLPAKRRLGR